MGLVSRSSIHIVNNCFMHVPSYQIDGRQGCHRAPRVWSNQVVQEHHAIVRHQLSDFVHGLERDPVAGKGRPVSGFDKTASQPLVQQLDHALDDRGVGLRMWDDLGTHDYVRRVEEMDAQKMLAEGWTAS